MLSTLLVAAAAVASASLEPRFGATTEEIIGRVGGDHKVGDACHPSYNVETCNKDQLQPPCPTEQVLSRWCEDKTKGSIRDATEEQRKAYRDCLFGEGSSFPAIQRACIECKVANGWFTETGAKYLNDLFDRGNDKFKSNISLPGSLWDTVKEEDINWTRVNTGNRNTTATPVEMEKYISNPILDLKTGRYTLNGTTLGGDLDCDKAETEACSGDDRDKQVTESAAVPKLPVEAPVKVQDPIGLSQEVSVSIDGKNKTANVYLRAISFIWFDPKHGRVLYLSYMDTGILDPSSNPQIMAQVADGKCDNCPPAAPVNDIIAASPSKPTSDDKAAELLVQSLPSNATSAGPIDNAAKNKAMETVLEQYPKVLEADIPETVQTNNSQTPQAGAKASCKRAQRLRV